VCDKEVVLIGRETRGRKFIPAALASKKQRWRGWRLDGERPWIDETRRVRRRRRPSRRRSSQLRFAQVCCGCGERTLGRQIEVRTHHFVTIDERARTKSVVDTVRIVGMYFAANPPDRRARLSSLEETMYGAREKQKVT
jgi:hypothetical protein